MTAELRLAELRRREREREARDLDLLEQAFDTDAWGASLFAVDVGLEQRLPPMLLKRWEAGALGGAALQTAIHAVWVHNPSPVKPIGERAWLRLFKSLGYFWATEEVAGKANAYAHITDQPTMPQTIWRGAGRATNGRGMAWSAYVECARGFAEAAALYGPAAVFQATVPARAVLALFGDEREQEFVINPNMLRDRVSIFDELAWTPMTFERRSDASVSPSR